MGHVQDHVMIAVEIVDYLGVVTTICERLLAVKFTDYEQWRSGRRGRVRVVQPPPAAESKGRQN
jgi:uncharacterized membrane protein